MKRNIKHPDICLFTIALFFSKLTGSIVTIRYGEVIIEFNSRQIKLRFTEGKDITVFMENTSVVSNQIWVMYIPLSKLLDREQIFETLKCMLDCEFLVEEINATLSIPFNYLNQLLLSKIINFDFFLTPTNSDRLLTYEIIKEKDYCLYLVHKNKKVNKFKINILVRDGKGNEDL